MRGRDTAAVLDVLREVNGCLDVDGFARVATCALRRLVPADRCSYSDVSGPRIRTYIDADGFLSGHLGEALSRHGHENPILAHYRRTRQLTVSTFSDFLTSRQLQRLDLYNEYYRYVEVEHQVIAPLRITGGPGAREIGIAMSRRRVDFSVRDRRLLQLIQPHLIQAHDRAGAAERLRAHLAFLEAAVDEPSRGAVLLGRAATVRFASRRARELLQRYFTPGALGRDELPEPVARWLADHERAAGAVGGVPEPRRPLVVARDARQLWVRFVAGPDRHALLLEERGGAVDPAGLLALGLTAREAEVLAWVADGKTNDEIGTILGARPATVAKHLERIYGKLGVETRTAAAVQALAAAGAPAREPHGSDEATPCRG